MESAFIFCNCRIIYPQREGEIVDKEERQVHQRIDQIIFVDVTDGDEGEAPVDVEEEVDGMDQEIESSPYQDGY